MHILYIHQHFAVPAGSTGTRSYEFARRWVEAGHTVTVLSGRYDIGGLHPKPGLISRLVIDGIQVIVVGTTYSNKQSYPRRAFAFVCFTLLATCVALWLRNVDVVYATSTPLTVGIPAMIAKIARRIPFVFEVRDQWPEAPIEIGVIKNRILAKLLLCLEKQIYRLSSAIVALSPGMAEGIKAAIDFDRRVEIIPNSSDTQVFSPDIDGTEVRKACGWDEKLVFLHFGAMSKLNGLDFVVEAAQKLRDHSDIHFVLVGDGSEKERLLQMVTHEGLKNIEILDPLPKRELVRLVAACDVSMVIFANYPVLEYNSANKFFDSLSAGKPVLLNYSGWQREIVEENKAGLGCELCNVDEFVDKVLYLYSHRELLPEMGRNARELAVRMFDRDKLAQQALEVVTSVASSRHYVKTDKQVDSLITFPLVSDQSSKCSPTRASKHPTAALTVDLEDYWSVFFRDWLGRRAEPTNAVVRNAMWFLDTFAQYGCKATFFVLAEVAEKFPSLVKDIASAGHEIASHGVSHRQIFKLSPEQFRAEVRRSKLLLEDLTSQCVAGFRAPAFSIMPQTKWALGILAEEGYAYDSSVFPIKGGRYGWPGFCRTICIVELSGGRSIIEVPLTAIKIAGKHWPVGGGGYIRHLPYAFTRWALRSVITERPVVVYLHPYEIDTQRTRLDLSHLPYLKRTKVLWHHKLQLRNRNTTVIKVTNLLQEFSFDSITNVIKGNRWPSVTL